MTPFTYERAADAPSAVARVREQPGATFLGGGTNLVDHMKLGVARPDLVVDVTSLPLDRIQPGPEGGLRIGAMVRNSDLAADPAIRTGYPVLSQALLAGASPQLRNLATTGGQPPAAHPLRLLPGRDHTVQQAPARRRLRGNRGLYPLSRDPGRLRSLYRRAPVRHGGRPGGAGRQRPGAQVPAASARFRSPIFTAFPGTRRSGIPCWSTAT